MRFFACCFLIAVTGCQRERRDLRPAPPDTALLGIASRQSELEPGGPQSQPSASNPFHGNAFAISEGQRLFGWYNCSGCHANGGGGIGPPLIKQEWTYGGEPSNLFDTIVKGRPNGMPTWGGRIPEYQVWQLVSYIQSLNNQQPKAATAVRVDILQTDPHTIITRQEESK